MTIYDIPGTTLTDAPASSTVCDVEDVKLLQVRTFPADAYELLRRLTYERGPKATHGEVIADALRCLAEREAEREGRTKLWL